MQLPPLHQGLRRCSASQRRIARALLSLHHLCTANRTWDKQPTLTLESLALQLQEWLATPVVLELRECLATPVVPEFLVPGRQQP